MSNPQELKNRVNKLLNYDPTSGLFTWKVKRSGIRMNKIAGCINDKGYVVIRIDGKLYKAHRLAWLIMTGNFPTAEVDHKDLNKSNNTFDNLREATMAQNARNRAKRCNNTSNYVGVSFNKRSRKWRSYICFENTQYHLGYFDSAKDAAIERDKAAMKMHLQFARLNFKYEITRNNELRVLNMSTDSI